MLGAAMDKQCRIRGLLLRNMAFVRPSSPTMVCIWTSKFRVFFFHLDLHSVLKTLSFLVKSLNTQARTTERKKILFFYKLYRAIFKRGRCIIRVRGVSKLFFFFSKLSFTTSQCFFLVTLYTAEPFERNFFLKSWNFFEAQWSISHVEEILECRNFKRSSNQRKQLGGLETIAGE